MTDRPQRTILPIPDRPYDGAVTYDAKDPATSFPPIDLGEDSEDADHLITPEERLRVAMARQ